jgi:hypothetical protein
LAAMRYSFLVGQQIAFSIRASSCLIRDVRWH